MDFFRLCSNTGVRVTSFCSQVSGNVGPWPNTSSLPVDFLTTSIKSFCERYGLCECVYICLGHCQGRYLNYSWPAALPGFNNSSISQTQRQTPRTNVRSGDLRKIRETHTDTHHLISHCLRASSVWDGASETQDTHGVTFTQTRHIYYNALINAHAST